MVEFAGLLRLFWCFGMRYQGGGFMYGEYEEMKGGST